MTTVDELTERFEYLDNFRDGDLTNMFEAAPHMKRFFKISGDNEACSTLLSWIETFGDGKSQASERAALVFAKNNKIIFDVRGARLIAFHADDPSERVVGSLTPTFALARRLSGRWLADAFGTGRSRGFDFLSEAATWLKDQILEYEATESAGRQ